MGTLKSPARGMGAAGVGAFERVVGLLAAQGLRLDGTAAHVPPAMGLAEIRAHLRKHGSATASGLAEATGVHLQRVYSLVGGEVFAGRMVTWRDERGGATRAKFYALAPRAGGRS